MTPRRKTTSLPEAALKEEQTLCAVGQPRGFGFGSLPAALPKAKCRGIATKANKAFCDLPGKMKMSPAYFAQCILLLTF